MHFTKAALQVEADKFANMLKEMDTNNLITIFIVCATNYALDIQDEFCGKGSITYSDYKCDDCDLKEVIILNLSSQKF